MPKVKYDLSGVEDLPDTPHAPVGTYIGKIEAVDARDSSKGNPMLEVRWILTNSADGSRLKEEFQPIWDYPILEHDSKFVMGKTKAFFEAIGMKLKGTLDTDKIVGKKAQLKLKSDTDQDGEYRPRINKVLPVGAGSDDAAPEDEPEPEEPETEEPEAEEEDEEGIDLDQLDRAALKKLIKDEQLGIRVMKNMTDDQVREAIAEAMSEEEEEDEPEEDEPEEEAEAEPEDESEDGGEDDEGDGYDGMSLADLTKEFKERELDPAESGVKGKKGAKLKEALIKALRDDDGDSPF